MGNWVSNNSMDYWVSNSMDYWVSNSVGNGDGGSVSGVSETVTKKVLGISISLGLSLGLTLGDGMVAVSDGGDNSGGVTQEVGDLHADLLVLNLLGVDGAGHQHQ